MSYDLKPLKAPVANGAKLKTLVGLLENGVTGALLANSLLANAGILNFRKIPADQPPQFAPELTDRTPRHQGQTEPSDDALHALQTHEGFQFETTGSIVHAYLNGHTRPSEVAQRVLEASSSLEQLSPSSKIFIAQKSEDLLQQAAASDERYARGEPISPLDGVPIGVKDEIDQAGYPTTVGTRFLGGSPASHDSEVVARLRRMGAILIGKTNMHEIGIGVTGINPHHGTPRNPYGLEHVPGGSSSGSAVAVAAGLCPMAIGLDGGGSIRIPSSFCGVVGLKATFGRLSLNGAAPLAWTVGHVGPIAASVRDAALMYRTMAGPDTKDPLTSGQPSPDLKGVLDSDLSGVRVGVYRPWFEDAAPNVVSACTQMVEVLEKAGAEVREVEIPNLSLLRTVHLVAITGEMAAAMLQQYSEHRKDLGLETRINLALSRRFQAYDYVHAARHRRAICALFDAILEEVDVIASPTTACTAPSASPMAFETGESNVGLVGKIMRYAPAGNTTGLPAISLPAGYDRKGMPIGFQLMGRAWEEALLLRLAAVCETSVEKKKPGQWYSLLGGTSEGSE